MNKTKIEWTDRTSNPIYAERIDTGKRGWACTKPSTGCKFCYAEEINKRFGTGLAYHESNLDKVRFVVNADELQRILKLKTPSKIFIGDMLDIFHEAIGFNKVYKVFEYMMLGKQHTFQILTKRAGMMCRLIPEIYFQLKRNYPDLVTPLPNVQLGISAENQSTLIERYSWLAQTSAATRFWSLEPLLEGIDIHHEAIPHLSYVVDWIIVGCESGRRPRPMEIGWVRDIRNKCATSRIPFFFKQAMDGKKKISLPVLDGQSWAQFPSVEGKQ